MSIKGLGEKFGFLNGLAKKIKARPQKSENARKNNKKSL